MLIKACIGGGFFWVISRWFQKEQGGRHQLFVENGLLEVGLAEAECYSDMWTDGKTCSIGMVANRQSEALCLSLRKRKTSHPVVSIYTLQQAGSFRFGYEKYLSAGACASNVDVFDTHRRWKYIIASRS